MAMLWLMLVGLVVTCDGLPGQIGDLDDEFYLEVRDLLRTHAAHQVSTTVHSVSYLDENTLHLHNKYGLMVGKMNTAFDLKNINSIAVEILCS
jgi:hypothetical protein